MDAGVLYYSRTGNNRRLAETLGRRLRVVPIEVRPLRRRYFWRKVRDILYDRRPELYPLARDPASIDRLVVVAPVWGLHIAHPMKTALAALGARMPAYVLASLCGYERDGQAASLRGEAKALTGRAPEMVVEMRVGDLVPEGKRRNVRTVSGHRATAAELASREGPIGRIAGWAVAARREGRVKD